MTDEERGNQDGDGSAEVSPWHAEVARLGVTGALDVLSRGIADVVRTAPTMPSRAAVRFGCASIEIEWPTAVPVAPDPPTVTSEPPAGVQPHVVRAPLAGTFHHAPAPGSRPFVGVGDLVEPGQQVGVLEAMKIRTPIAADVRGRVSDILVGDAEAVEFDQPLLVLTPALRADLDA
nr:biotin carboxyl carrier protein [uncultured bacterium]